MVDLFDRLTGEAMVYLKQLMEDGRVHSVEVIDGWGC